MLQAGLTAYQYAELHHIVHQPYLAIIDMVLPSSAKRLWVFDLHTRQLMLHDLVAHGKGSGVVYATHFSNEVNSDATSIGVYRTGKAYVGNDGLSLRLYGLEPGFNDNAYQRDIVIHGAAYVSEVFVKQYHRTGRSWGCPAVSLHKHQTFDPFIAKWRIGADLLSATGMVAALGVFALITNSKDLH